MLDLYLVWNREFDWSYHKSFEGDKKDEAIKYAKELANSGDGARVKKVQIVDDDGKVIFKC